MMRIFAMALAVGLMCVVSAGMAAEEAAEGQEEKPKQQEKGSPDSAISFVSHLVEVGQWQQWLESQGDGETLSVWGAALKQVAGHPCSEVAVAAMDEHSVPHVWIYFCVTPKRLRTR